MTGRAADVALVCALAVLLTAAIAMPVLRAPGERVFGMEIVGRQPDPFTAMAQFARPLTMGLYTQPATDVPGAVLARAAGPVAAYNWLILLTFPLSAAAAYLLARHLAIPVAGSLFAALAFAFSPFHLAHAAYHPHVAQVQWIPLYLLALWRCLDRATAAAAGLLAAAIAGVTLSNFYGGLIAAVLTPVAVAAYWYVESRHHPSATRHLGVTVSVLVLVAATGAAYVAIVAPDVFAHPAALGFARADLFTHSAKWWSYLVPPVEHPLLGGFARDLWRGAGVREGLLEQQVALGWAVIALGGVAVLAWLSNRRAASTLRAVPLLVVLAMAALLCGLSPERESGTFRFVRPSAFLYAIVPMFRSYARFGVVLQLMAVLLAGIGAAHLWSAGTRRTRLVSTLLVALAAAEYAVWPPAMSRDALPTAAHRWIVRQPGRVLAFDCAARTPADESIAWLTGDRIALRDGWLDDCTEPNLADRLAAAGYTHLIVRARSPEGRWLSGHRTLAGLQPAAQFRDSEVRAITVPPPTVYTVRMTGFHARERDADWTWRWMGGEASWTVANTSGLPITASVDADISTFNGPRRLTILLDGCAVQSVVLDGGRTSRRLGPFTLLPGDHALVFRSTDPTTVANDLLHNGDRRALSFAIGDWRWAEEGDR